MLFRYNLRIVVATILITQISLAQDTTAPEKYTAHNKGKFFVYWGGNRETFTKSDIRFYGEGYDFTLQNVTA